MTDENAEQDAGKTAGTEAKIPKVVWDDSNMKTSYANVVNTTSTREEVTIYFGTNQTWNVQMGQEVTVQLSDRIVLNPYAAKRLWTLMGSVLKEYESRYGTLDLRDTGTKAGST